MAWTTPRTFVAAELLTASIFNTHLRDNLNAVRDYMLGAQDLGSNWKISTGRSLLFSDPDVAHGMTGVDATDVWGRIAMRDSLAGGMEQTGFADDDRSGLWLAGINGSATPTLGGLTLVAWKKNGTTVQNIGAAEPATLFKNGTALMGQFYGNGNLEIPGGLVVGFTGTGTADQLQVGDANFALYWAGSGDTRLQFDTNDYFGYDRTNNILQFSIGSAVKFQVTSTALAIVDGSEGSPSFALINSLGTGIYRVAANEMGFCANSTRYLSIIAAGVRFETINFKALGGGAAPTLGTIGGTGPATAAQNKWLKLLDGTGTAVFVPVWV